MNEERILEKLFTEATECYELSPGVRQKVLERIASDKKDGIPQFKLVKSGRYRIILSTISLLLIFLLVAFNFASPVVSQALDRIGGLFAVSQDNGMKTAFEHGFLTEINETRTDQGIEVMLTDFYSDTMRVSFGIKVKLSETAAGNDSRTDLRVENVKYQSRDWETSMISADLVKIGENTYAATKEIFLPPVGNVSSLYGHQASVPDVENVRLTIKKIAGVQGNWSFEFPIDMQKVKAATKIFAMNETLKSTKGQVTLKSVSFTPSGIDARFAIRSEDINIDHTKFQNEFLAGLELSDAAGHRLVPLSESEIPKGSSFWLINNGEIHAFFEPLGEIPKNLAIKMDSPFQAELKINLQFR